MTIGSPRVLDPQGASYVTNLLNENHIYRYWRPWDPVSALAPGILGFKHVGADGGLMLPTTGSWNFLTEHHLGEDLLRGERPATKGYKGIRTTLMEWFLIPWKNKNEDGLF